MSLGLFVTGNPQQYYTDSAGISLETPLPLVENIWWYRTHWELLAVGNWSAPHKIKEECVPLRLVKTGSSESRLGGSRKNHCKSFHATTLGNWVWESRICGRQTDRQDRHKSAVSCTAKEVIDSEETNYSVGENLSQLSLWQETGWLESPGLRDPVASVSSSQRGRSRTASL